MTITKEKKIILALLVIFVFMILYSTIIANFALAWGRRPTEFDIATGVFSIIIAFLFVIYVLLPE